jgi:hypothetical protein
MMVLVVLQALLLLLVSTQAFQPAKSPCRGRVQLQATRRGFVEGVSTSIGAALVAHLLVVPHASASGGATAGGAYLLSAKQRYNDRVTKGVDGFLALQTPLTNGDIETVRSYFTNQDAGNWKDFMTAGYLLANAFRRNSTAAPDSLPSVKAWKAFAAEVESMTKALKKKDTKSALEAYNRATAALDGYLEKVELPLAVAAK